MKEKIYIDDCLFGKTLCRRKAHQRETTVVLRNLQKVLDKGPISAKGLRCHRNSLATIGYSRDSFPKSQKNVSYCIRYLEKTLKICEFFYEICISDFAKMG